MIFENLEKIWENVDSLEVLFVVVKTIFFLCFYHVKIPTGISDAEHLEVL